MNNTFLTARIRLTILFTVVFGSLILVFSGVLYKMFADDIHEDMVNVYQSDKFDVEIINRHKIPVRNFIIYLDLGVLVFISGASYYLAGVTLKPIQENAEAEKRFVANASHELRTPIAILKTDMEVYLLDQKFPESLRPVFSGYLEEINNMKLIVENMLTLFRFESHQVKMNHEKVFLSKLVKANVLRMKPFAESKGVSLKMKVESRICVLGDKFFLQQALRNIIKNAIEYSNKEGDVTVRLNNLSNKTVITVADNGIGIPKEVLSKIFNRFERSKASTKKRKEGVGLGLSIAKQIIDLHAGTIEISSVEGSGTNVHISLPRKAA